MVRRLFLSFLALSILSGGVWLAGIDNTQAQETGGFIDQMTERNALTGWAYDQRNPSDPVSLRIDIDDQRNVLSVPTDIPRRDVQQRYGTPLHAGFSFTVPNRYLDGQRHTIRLYAKNLRTGAEVELANSPYTIQTYDPGVTGFTDRVRDGVLQGWVFDNAHKNNPIPVMAYEGDFRTGRLLGTGVANRERTDVAEAYDTDSRHGFAVPLDLETYSTGENLRINVYAVDRTRGQMKLLETREHMVE